MLHDFNALRQMFLDYLSSQKFKEAPVGLYEPINYIMELGGKRVRPVSMLITNNIYSDDLKNALPVAYAFEMFHNFTLAHDDVMDDAGLRRGKAAVHVKYGLNSAILSGDAMLIYAYKYIIEATDDPKLQKNLLDLFTETAIDICKGQQMDMDFEDETSVDLSDYLLMIKYKTAVLLAACMKAGALIGKASAEEADHLYAYGLNLGLAFQIQDDLLDLYADKTKFGKKVGGDIVQQKKTYLYLKAIELLENDEAKHLIDLYNSDFGNEEDKINQIRAVFDKLKVWEHAERLMEELTENAEDHLKWVKVKKDRFYRLKELSQMLLQRMH